VKNKNKKAGERRIMGKQEKKDGGGSLFFENYPQL